MIFRSLSIQKNSVSDFHGSLGKIMIYRRSRFPDPRVVIFPYLSISCQPEGVLCGTGFGVLVPAGAVAPAAPIDTAETGL